MHHLLRKPSLEVAFDFEVKLLYLVIMKKWFEEVIPDIIDLTGHKQSE
jgi:hypothetical protein